MAFKNRTIKKVDAVASLPHRVDFETEAEYLQAVEEYNAALTEEPAGHTDDVEHGAGVTGWVDPDTVTGPGVQKGE